MGAINVATTLIGGLIIDKFGRKIILLIGNLLCIIFLFILAYFIESENFSSAKWIILLYVFSFAISFGPIVGIYLAETLPDKAMGIAVCSCWVMNILVGLGFPILSNPNVLDMHGVFLLFTFFCFICEVFIIFFVKETSGKTPAEIQKMFSDENDNQLPLIEKEMTHFKP